MKKVLFIIIVPALMLVTYFLGFSYSKHLYEEPQSINEGLTSLGLWDSVQKWRIKNGYVPYILDGALCPLAEKRAKETHIEWSHRLFAENAEQYQKELGTTWLGENLIKGDEFLNSDVGLNMWVQSPEHRKNLTSDSFKYSCIGCDGNNCVQIFAGY